MMRLMMAAVLVTAAFFVPAKAQEQTCFPYEPLKEGLAGEYGEKPVITGVLGNGDRLEITMNKDGNFSILIVDPESGMACLPLAGEALRLVKPPRAKKPKGDAL